MDIKKVALLSVSDKTNLDILALGLIKNGYKILSTGGTATYLQSIGMDVLSIESLTGVKEIMDGRVKTLHPKIFAGLLARRDNSTDIEELENMGALAIDIVAVNLYPFADVIVKKESNLHSAIEHIDIGGVSLLRAAAKNYKDVLVLSHPDDYAKALLYLDYVSIMKETRKDADITCDNYEQYKMKQAIKAFSLTAEYDAHISNYLQKQGDTQLKLKKIVQHKHVFPDTLHLVYKKSSDLRYGENPHQSAALYEPLSYQDTNILTGAKQLNGKQLSYNNFKDAKVAIDIAQCFTGSTVVGIKHGNPCAVAVAPTIEKAWKKAYVSDPVSIFGGIVIFTKEVDEKLAKHLSKIFLEIIIAPNFTKQALTLLQQKKNLRLLQVSLQKKEKHYYDYVSVANAMLVQEHDTKQVNKNMLQCVTKKKPTKLQLESLVFAWKVVKHVKSNAIVVANNTCTTGIGAGQMNRVQAVRIALEQAKRNQNTVSIVLASDAFFPMRDSVDLAHEYGIRAIIQPGGSIRDQDSIDACNEYGIAMIFTNTRHFLH